MRRTVLSLTIISVATLLAAGAAWAATVQCSPYPPYCHGTAENDEITGSAEGDQVAAGGGADTLRGLGGDDGLMGQADDDTIYGGSGDDYLDGAGRERGELGDADGERSNDRLYGDDGDDSLWGGLGSDIVVGGQGEDTLYADNSYLDCRMGPDDVVCYSRNGVDGRDRVFGGARVDYINVQDGYYDYVDCGPPNPPTRGSDIIYFDGGLDRVVNCEVQNTD